MNKIIYFTAQWCSPCKIFGPILSDVVSSLKKSGKELELVKIDADSNPEMVKMHSVRAFPTIVILADNKEVGRHVGLVSKARLEDIVNNAIA